MPRYRDHKNWFPQYEGFGHSGIAAVNNQGIRLSQELRIVHLAPVVSHIAVRVACATYCFNFEGRGVLFKRMVEAWTEPLNMKTTVRICFGD